MPTPVSLPPEPPVQNGPLAIPLAIEAASTLPRPHPLPSHL